MTPNWKLIEAGCDNQASHYYETLEGNIQVIYRYCQESEILDEDLTCSNANDYRYMSFQVFL
jgi:hypothetical protein